MSPRDAVPALRLREIRAKPQTLMQRGFLKVPVNAATAKLPKLCNSCRKANGENDGSPAA